MLDAWRRRVARWIAPGRVATRAYAGARATRHTVGFGSAGNSSADAELAGSLSMLRSRSRQLMRDAPYAKRARLLLMNNVVGAGVGLQAKVQTTRKEPSDRVNAAIETAFAKWSCPDACHTGGALHFSDFERACMSELFTAGEAFVRMHLRRFGGSEIPLALELIEAERLADENAVPLPIADGSIVRMGVECDAFGRALAYWVRDRHPGDLKLRPEQSSKFVRVPAAEMIHLRIIERWPQTRGEPWLHAVLRKLNDMNEYVGSELDAARQSANYFATIESPDADPLPGTPAESGEKELVIEPGVIDRLSPGDKLNFHAPNRPNTALDPFMRYMLREYSAGTGISYEAISGDYSQSNYSSSRLGKIDERDMFRVLQAWWARSFRAPLHHVWMQQAVLARAIPSISVESYALNPDAFEVVRWKFRGWSWIDPAKEVAAYKEAVKAGFTTVTKVIEQTAGGDDRDDLIEEREDELEAFAKAGIELDTTVSPAAASGPAVAPAPPVDDDVELDDGAKPARVVSIAR